MPRPSAGLTSGSLPSSFRRTVPEFCPCTVYPVPDAPFPLPKQVLLLFVLRSAREASPVAPKSEGPRGLRLVVVLDCRMLSGEVLPRPHLHVRELRCRAEGRMI